MARVLQAFDRGLRAATRPQPRARGIDAWGIENNCAIHARTPKELKKFNSPWIDRRSPFKDGEFYFVFETSLCHVTEKRIAKAIRELNRVVKKGLVFGSVTSDMPAALIDRYDLLRGVKKLGTWWEWSELFFGNGFDLSMHRHDCTDEVWAATLGGQQRARPVVCRSPTPCVIRSSTRSRTTSRLLDLKSLRRKRRLCDGVRLRCTSKRAGASGKVTCTIFFAERTPIA